MRITSNLETKYSCQLYHLTGKYKYKTIVNDNNKLKNKTKKV